MAPDLSESSVIQQAKEPPDGNELPDVWHSPPQDQWEKLSGHQLGQTFNEHLQGLLAAFQCLQQQNYELKQENAAFNEIHDIVVSPRKQEEANVATQCVSPSPASTLLPPPFPLSSQRDSELSLAQMTHCQTSGKHQSSQSPETEATQSPSSFGVGSSNGQKAQLSQAQVLGDLDDPDSNEHVVQSKLKSQTSSITITAPGQTQWYEGKSNAFIDDPDSAELLIAEQFERLQDPRRNLLYSNELARVVYTFTPVTELESLLDVLDYVTEKSKKKHATVESVHSHDDPEGDFDLVNPKPKTQSHEQCDLLNHGIDFAAFLKLRADQELLGATHAIKRDVRSLREALRSEELHALYEDDGHLAEDQHAFKDPPTKVARFLEFSPPVVIIMNALVFGLQAEIATTSVFWDVVEVIFTCFYFFEAVLKIYLIGCCQYFFGPEKMWNWLDFVCLATSLADLAIAQLILIMGVEATPNLGIFMLLKLLRLVRLARLVRALRYPIFRELNLMVMGVVSGMRVLMWAFVLLISLIYVLGLIMLKLVGEEQEEFSTIWAAMFSLFRCFTQGCDANDGTPLNERLRQQYGIPFLIGYMCAYILVSVGVFNLIMAIFIDNVVNSQAERKQQDISDTSIRTEVALKECLVKLLIQSRTNGVPPDVEEEIRALETTLKKKSALVRAQFDCIRVAGIHITRDAFAVWLDDPRFLEVLSDADIEIHNKTGLFDIIDADMGGSLTADEVFVGLMKLRGPVTKGDIVGTSLRIRHIAIILQEAFGAAGAPAALPQQPVRV